MNGVLNVLKPPSMSSGQAVGALRRLLGVKKVGHTGTLDPGAAGVLPICVGRATRIADYIMSGDKEYIAEATFGLATDTLDSYGSVVQTGGRSVSRAEIEAVIPGFCGEIEQYAPMYSAVKQNGQPLYKLARAGVSVQKPPRRVTVYGIELLEACGERFLFKINCSKGTYIRTLLADMAAELKSCAYTSFLLRSKSGGFTLEGAYTLDELQNEKVLADAMLSPEDALSFMDEVRLPGHIFPIVDSGAAIDLDRVRLDVPEGNVRVYCNGVFMGVGARRENMLKMLVKLNI